MTLSKTHVLGGIFIASSSVFFLRGIFFQGVLHPVLLFALIAILFCFYHLFFTKTVRRIDIVNLSLFLSAAVFVVLQNSIVGLQYGFANELGRFCLPFITLLTLSYIFRSREAQLASMHAVTAFLIVDTVYRIVLNNPVNLFSADRYLVKAGGLLFMDSNFTATFSAVILVFMYENGIRSRYIFWTNVFIVIACKSYAVWFGLALVLVFAFAIRRIFTPGIFLSTTVILLFAITFLDSEQTIEFLSAIDGSLASKAKILFTARDLISLHGQSIFWGIGLGNFSQFSNYASHNIFGLTVELGLIGTGILMVPYIVALAKKENRNTVAFVLVTGGALFPVLYLGYFYFLVIGNLHLQGFEDKGQ